MIRPSPRPALFHPRSPLHLGLAVGLFAGPLASAATVAVTNPGFDQGAGGQISGTLSLVSGTSTMGPQQIGTSGWYGLSNATNLVVVVPVAGFRPAIAVNNGSSSLNRAEINFALGASLGGLAGLELPEADLWQSLSGVNLLPNSTYTLGVDVDTGAVITSSNFLSVGFGIGISTGASTTSLGTMYADSLSSPALLSLSPLSGTNQRLTLTFTTGSSVPSGNVGITLFGGRGTQSISLALLNDFRMDNVSLTVVPEPPSLALCALGALALLRRQR